MSRCRLKEWYNIVVRPDLMAKMQYTNTHAVPKLSALLLSVAQVDLLELYEHCNRRAQIGTPRMRVPARRPHETAHATLSAIHQPRLNPQIGREQHRRILAQVQ